MRKYYVKQFSNYAFLTVITYVHLLESIFFPPSVHFRLVVLSASVNAVTPFHGQTLAEANEKRV